MSTDQRNDGLHPKHPGKGKCSVIEMESSVGRVEDGGFIIFLPSGDTEIVAWQNQLTPIQPTLEAAKDFCVAVVQRLIEKGGPDHPDIHGVNWTSVAAAVQRVILDWNEKIQAAAKAQMGKLIGPDGKPLLH